MSKLTQETKVLTVCSRGNSRSVCLAWLFKDHMGMDAIACGIDAAKSDTFEMLGKWADLIVVVDKELVPKIPKKFKKKLEVWDVGGDRYFRGFEPDLINQYITYINNYIL